MMELEYDINLELVAQAYVDKHPKFVSHNHGRSDEYQALGGKGYVGENWAGFWDSGPNWWRNSKEGRMIWAVATAPINMFCYSRYKRDKWCTEEECYWAKRGKTLPNGKTPPTRCKGGCIDGHYAQVIRPGVNRVGCGFTASGGVYCNYATVGFITGAYDVRDGDKTSKQCSACPAAYGCKKGLCAQGGTIKGLKSRTDQQKKEQKKLQAAHELKKKKHAEISRKNQKKHKAMWAANEVQSKHVYARMARCPAYIPANYPNVDTRTSVATKRI
jgi:hypothetical protein